uniref:Reverse transcriptase domain-containing protein n=1 Tax=Tanacetum cinerariifolium TaxID=118510 RepID=A0A6L2NJK1_TANCI|nr:reverse transcriptase domain-containing protein [Tanacetum cinerariifolium]
MNPKDPLRGRSHAHTLGASRGDHNRGGKDFHEKYVKDPVEIHNIKQRDGETFEDFMERFKIETGRMKGAPECMRISGFMHGINNPELTKCLNEHVPRTMEEMMIATAAFIRGEAAAPNKKKGHIIFEPRTDFSDLPLAAATWQHPIGHPPVTWHLRQHRSAPVNDGQRHRPTTVNDAGNRSTAADHGGDQRSTVAVNDGRGWRTTIDCRWTTVDHHRTTGQRCWGKARESEGTNSGNKEHKSGGDMLGMRRLKTSSENDEYEAFLDVWKQVLRENPTLIYNKHGHSLLKIKKRRFMFKEPLPPTVDTSRTESVAPCLHFVGQEEDQQARLEASCPPVASLTGKQSISLELEVSLSLVELLLKLSIKIVQTLIHTFTRPMSASWANNVIPRVTVEAIVALLAPVLKVQTKKSDLKPTEVVDIIV